jgi:hypothetical protein
MNLQNSEGSGMKTDQRGRDQREKETPDQQLARQQHRNESDYARCENETSEEKQQLWHNRNEFDQAHHAAAVASGVASGDVWPGTSI